MKIDIPYYIRQVLREQREVYVPQIGTFKLVQSPARLSDDKLNINPPTLDIDFEDGRSDDTSLSEYIVDTGKFSLNKINQAISEFTESTFNKLINVNVSEIDGLGTLKKEENQDEVTFSPIISSFTKEYKDLSPIGLKPIERIKEDNKVSHVVDTSDVNVVKTSRFSWLQPIIAGILIAAIAILLVKTCMNKDDTTYHNPDESAIGMEEGNQLSGDNTSKTDISEKLDEEYSEVDDMLEDKDDMISSSPKVKEELSHLDKSNNDQESITEEEPEVKSQEIEKSVSTEGINNKYVSIIPETGNCIIILGSFTRATNIIKMMSLIERDGKKVYKSQYQGKTRVGFSFDCSDVELDVYLNEIRKKFSTKAWYLDPIVSIPYK